MPMRPASSTPMAMPKPLPSSPSMFSFGQTYSTNSISHVADARMPSFGSVLPAWNPGSVVSMMNADTPLAPLPGLVIANSTMYFATGPDVIQLFLPLMTQSPAAFFAARVCMFDASEPDCGSVSAYAPIASPSATARTYFCFCSSLPYLSIPLQYSVLLTDMIVESAQSADAISIIASA